MLRTGREEPGSLITEPGTVEALTAARWKEVGLRDTGKQADDKVMNTMGCILHDQALGVVFHTETVKRVREVGIS